MGKRSRDLGRKYPSGSKKRAIYKAKAVEREKQKGALSKYFSRPDSAVEPEELSEDADMAENPPVEHTTQTENDSSGEDFEERNQSEEDPQDRPGEEKTTTRAVTGAEGQECWSDNQGAGGLDPEQKGNFNSAEQIEISDDPAAWPEYISQRLREYLLKQGPPKIIVEDFPKNKIGKHFSKFHCQRKLSNGETVPRPWVIYSVSADKIFCYYCKVLCNNVTSSLASDGFNDWSNIHTRLAEHENSKGHLQAVLTCCDLQQRLSAEKATDAKQPKFTDQEARRWHQVFERLVAVVQLLAERNLSFHGSDEQLGTSYNGNFLGVIELLGKFDPVMQEHLRRITNKEIHDHYLGNNIQNELVSIVGNAVKREIIARVKAAKYFAIILDCTSDSHQEQMSLTIRYVADGASPNIPAGVYEHFIKFIVVESSTGDYLYNILISELEDLGLDVANIRGQGFDSGATMKGNVSGVQARLLKTNPRAFCTPVECHNYHLILGDVAKTCRDVMSFFGALQRIYVLFSASTKSWTVLSKHVTGLSVKPLCETRWECRMQSVQALRYQAGEFYDALVEVAERTDDAQAKYEAESLAIEMKDYKFLVSLVFWHDLLSQVNFVSKELQRDTMDISAGISSVEKLCNRLKTYREKGFQEVLIGANELAEDLDVTPVFQTKRLRKRKNQFESESADEPFSDPNEAYREQCFNHVLDKALQALEPSVEQLQKHESLFGFLCEFKTLPKDAIRKAAADLELALTAVKLVQENEHVSSVKSVDINGDMLCAELEALKPVLPSDCRTPLQMLQFLAYNNRSTTFPNLFIAIRIFLTIPETVASGERSVSKLNLIKAYLRSTMQEDRFNSLAIMSIEGDVMRSLQLGHVLKEFAEEMARKRKL
ncbi:52 kDa repressor of the inhibitor of the protein kinase-like [Mauremys reevesii]|uniref:52 kDa repressor of the inhibitor of the protein kinase-like n=1 Tax=Mauremys reevesii TaxID=260615 RepID=UPI00193F2924|nr:52 kDa repressor of the inhibitor of the protein kinase-like [Mauremys reevesii]XP_039355880.1 52 kDa repressor of the inhibitor of the protein kinase-like [Mauremys reevesii]